MRVGAIGRVHGHGVLKNVQELNLKSVVMPLPDGRARDMPLRGTFLELPSVFSREPCARGSKVPAAAEYRAAVQVRIVSAMRRPTWHGRSSRGGWMLAKFVRICGALSSEEDAKTH